MVTGFKQTDIGLLPEDWDCIKIGMFASVTSGGTPSTSIPDFWNGDIPWMNSGDLNKKRVFSVNGRITKAGLHNSSTKIIPPYSVLLGLAGQGKTRGTAAINYISLAINQSIGAILPSKSFVSEFLYQYLDHSYNRIRDLSSAGGRGGISLDFLKSILCPLPTIQEQNHIAEALSAIDHLINSTLKLIAKKEAIKQGIVQEFFSKGLNTKASELGSIPENWEIHRIKDAFRLLSNNTFPRNVMNSECGFLQNIHYGDILTIYGAIIDCDKDRIPYLNPDIFIRDDLKLHSGDVIIADTAEDNTVGKTTEVINVGTRKVFAGLHTILLRPKNDRFVHGFLGLFFNTELFHAQLLPFVTGTKVSSISKESIKNLLVLCPPKNEQKEIVRIVCDSDKEISELQKYLEKLQDIKAGMMTELLTGRIRLQKDLSHDEQIDDAVMISAIVNAFYSDKYPLGRKKVQKLLYLARRHQNTTPTGFLKKAAGPYKPSARYSGGERIATKNGYVTIAESTQGARFAIGPKIAKAIDYAEQWGYLPVIDWLVENFKYSKVDELEVLATVDMAICDLKSSGQNCSVSEIKALINQNSEWRQKLQKPYFSDYNISKAIKTIQTIMV